MRRITAIFMAIAILGYARVCSADESSTPAPTPVVKKAKKHQSKKKKTEPAGAEMAPAAMSQAAPAVPETAGQVRDFSSFAYAGNDGGNILRLTDLAPVLKDFRISFQGWANASLAANSQGLFTHFNGPVGYTDKDNGQYNQVYFSLARTAPKDNKGFFLGGRADAFYGSDFFFAVASGWDGTAAGNTPATHNHDFTYGWAAPQAYLEADYDDLSLKAGHFYSIIGTESVMAKNNFFVTHSYAFTYGEPGTDSGFLVSRPFGHWSATAGLVSGWNQFSPSEGGKILNNFIGSVAYADSAFSAALNLRTGDDSDFNVPGIGPYSNRTVLDAVATVDLSKNLNYLMEVLYGAQAETFGFNALERSLSDWFGLKQELICQINPQWGAGFRFEWFNDPSGYLVTGLRPNNTDARFRFPGSFYEMSFGVNYKPIDNFTLRGEYRYDFYDGPGGYIAPEIYGFPPNQPFVDNEGTAQFLFALDAICQF